MRNLTISDKYGIGAAIGMALAIGLALAMQAVRARPVAH
jgi:hypothetical protein